MTTGSAIPNTAAEQLINHRLDAIDRALLDLFPRNERLALVAQVEARTRELVAANAVPDASLAGLTACPAPAEAVKSEPGAWSLPSLTVPSFLERVGRRRSRLALTSGLLGIVALVLLFMTPVTYFVVGFLGEVLGEIASIALLGIHLGVVTLGGLAAVGLGIAALVSLKRRRGALAGHGWALAGLCTGPLPMLGGAATGLILGMEMLGASTTCVQTSYSDDRPTEACYSIPERTSPPTAASPLPPFVAGPVASVPMEPRAFAAPEPAVHAPIQATAHEAPASEPEARPEPPGVPDGGGAGAGG
ncbi:MAG: hypothetical protein ACM3U2_04515 [Deltaproteobacteria bacterium]